MSAFADRGLLPDITFATNIFKNAPIHSGNLLQDAFSIHMSNNICGKRTSPRGKEKNAQFHIVHQLPIQKKRVQKWHMGRQAILQHLKNTGKNLGQRKPEIAVAEDNITKQSNWPSASSAHLRLFLARRFLSRTKEQKNGAHVAHNIVDVVLPFLIQ